MCCQILLNKIDLVDDAASLDAVEARIRTLNKRAPVLRCSNATGFDLSELLDVRAFDLKGVLEVLARSTLHLLHPLLLLLLHLPCFYLKLRCSLPLQCSFSFFVFLDFCVKYMTKMEPDFLSEGPEDHIHDDTISSVGIARPGECDLEKLNAWFSQLLKDQVRMFGERLLVHVGATFCIT